jgi:hypothetical protein
LQTIAECKPSRSHKGHISAFRGAGDNLQAEPNLVSYQELAEIAKRSGYLDGEINDALRHVGSASFRQPRIVPSEQERVQWACFFPENPEYKNYSALDLVFDELNLLLRSEGEGRAQIERSVLVERAVAKGKGGREIQYGNKLNLTTGRSGFDP